MKKDNIYKDIKKGGFYRPLCFKEAGKIKKVDYDMEEYCDLLVEYMESNTDQIETKSDFFASFGETVGIGEVIQNVDLYSDKELERVKEQKRKKIYRIHNRIINNKEKGSPNLVASDKTCYLFLRKVEKIFGRTLLTPINEEIPYCFEIKYIYSLLSQLIEIMYTSDFFNYVPNSKNYQGKCYENHLMMIKENIKEIFDDSTVQYSIWQEIISPFNIIIYEGSYPGIKYGDIWYQNCKELRFFDCTYEIAKNNYNLYNKVKEKLEFDLGNSREEVREEIKKCEEFFGSSSQSEKLLYCEKMLETLKTIIKKKFDVEV